MLTLAYTYGIGFVKNGLAEKTKMRPAQKVQDRLDAVNRSALKMDKLDWQVLTAFMVFAFSLFTLLMALPHIH